MAPTAPGSYRPGPAGTGTGSGSRTSTTFNSTRSTYETTPSIGRAYGKSGGRFRTYAGDIDSAAANRLPPTRISLDQLCYLVVLRKKQRTLQTRPAGPLYDLLPGERHDAVVEIMAGAVVDDDPGQPLDRLAGTEPAYEVLFGLMQADRRKAHVAGYRALLKHDVTGGADLLCRQRIQRMRVSLGASCGLGPARSRVPWRHETSITWPSSAGLSALPMISAVWASNDSCLSFNHAKTASPAPAQISVIQMAQLLGKAGDRARLLE